MKHARSIVILFSVCLLAFAADPALQLTRVHTNMIPVVQATNTTAALTALGAGTTGIEILASTNQAQAQSIIGAGSSSATNVNTALSAMTAAEAAYARNELALNSLRMAAAAPRHTYHSITTCNAGDDIATVLTGISSPSATKRCLLYVKNGTYTVSSALTMRSYVDVVGESRDGVVIQNNGGDWDTINYNASGSYLANFTAKTTRVNRYAIHMDNASGLSSAVVFPMWNVRLVADGEGVGRPKSTIGIGIWAGEILVFVDCIFESSNPNSGTVPGFLSHNNVTQTTSAGIFLINCTVSSTAGPGVTYSNLGSGQADNVWIIGGSIDGSGTGLTADLYHNNSGAGAGESLLFLAHGVQYTTKEITGLESQVLENVDMSCIPAIPWASNWEVPEGTMYWAQDHYFDAANRKWYLPNNGLIYQNNTANTAAATLQFATASANTFIRQAGNSSLYTGTDAYDFIVWLGNNYTFRVGVNGAVKLSVSGTSVTTTVPVVATQYKLSALNTAPASAAATGTVGEIRITADSIYVCVATDTWVKAALASW